ncbi:hypothetical protein C0Q70_02718 [Pomacea canaliculata]|uniref:Uncharacterized protein n=1 Tax=Pomacea canaliculata TaxID=400727 RepID=A0A2T7PQR4_POMCA|nr:hypothetical protein C0Q70_02718 [Pomacea canaliculata]
MNMALDGASCVSETVSLKELVSRNCLPALVRLEEGIRGDIESLSLSSGDVIALVACSGADNGQGTVLAHYTSERKIYNGGAFDTSEKDVYRALILLPLVNPQLASLEVSICQDSYGSFINTRFNGCDWVGREEEVLREKERPSSIVHGVNIPNQLLATLGDVRCPTWILNRLRRAAARERTQESEVKCVSHFPQSLLSSGPSPQ